MSDIKEKIAVMQAAENGAEIEYSRKGRKDWEDPEDGCPIWNWDLNDYRVKPAPKRKLYKYAIKGLQRWSETVEFYADDEDVMTRYENHKHFIRLDYTMIEVD